MTTELQAEGIGRLAQHQVAEGDAPGAGGPQFLDQMFGLITQSIAFEQPDHRQGDDEQRDGAVVGKGLTERGENFSG